MAGIEAYVREVVTATLGGARPDADTRAPAAPGPASGPGAPNVPPRPAPAPVRGASKPAATGARTRAASRSAAAAGLRPDPRHPSPRHPSPRRPPPHPARRPCRSRASRRAAADRVRPRGLPTSPGGRLPGGDRGPGRAAGDAHRRRQVALLPAPRARPRRHDARRLAAHRADGGPGREAPGARPARRAHPLGPRPGPLAAGARRLSRRPTRLPVHRAGAARRARLPRDARAGASRPWSPSTRPTASRSGGTTSGPTTACSASRLPLLRPAPSSPSPPPPRRWSRTTSPSSSACRSAEASSTASGATTSRSRRSRSWRRPCGAQAVARLLAGPAAAGPPSSTRRPARRPRRSARRSRHAFPAAAYHAGMTAERARPRAGGLPRGRAARSSSPPSPSAWGSTSPTCAR